jgi:hypothetical protein
MSPPDYYTLYINTENPTTGTTPSPNNNVIVISKQTSNSLCTFQVNWDALFKGKQSKYRKCLLRCLFSTEFSQDVTASSSNPLFGSPVSNRGVLSITGISNPNSNVSAIVLGNMERVVSEPNQVILNAVATGSFTGTVGGGATAHVLTTTADTLNPQVGDYINSGGQYYLILSMTGTAPTRTVYTSGLPTNATSSTYLTYRLGGATQQFYVVDTTDGVPEDISIPTGVSQIQVRTTNYALITGQAQNANSGHIPVGDYFLKLIFECYE